MQVSWANTSLLHTIRGATEPYDSQGVGRFSINGPDVGITSGGRVEIAWTIEDEKERLQLTWTEKDGPVVEAPTRRSFGTRMIGSLGQQLHGEVLLAYEPTGFIYKLDVPLKSLTTKV